ncbi:DNA polymerase IV [Flavobacteriaceae bacterium]|jgi:DNA polymerase-4|nr:DNA polymerase IV [Flavobacteriaceae bacterium]MDA7808040.1 DNA polymerase IV [Flavobacteriaceae bacterium]MDA8877649.1 DNA polymerase IV [Flavobacteriaceae bacterium]MDC0872834.1 DNA polymerase IV [Flavobacteriaceae bacterium]
MLEDFTFEAKRKIIHIDMDAFFASVEELDDPKLLGKAIAVGGGSRGVVAAASYEARKFGVRSAMSSVIAQKLCPHLIFVKPRFERYKEISNQIRSIFLEYTPLVEPLSLDEAYLDVSEYPSATLVAEEIRRKIKKKTGLSASAGISINKFLAKIASDWNKPDGQKTLPPEEVLDFLERLDVKKFHGIGKKTKLKMYKLGIYTGKDLKAQTLEDLSSHFGKAGGYYYQVVRGIHLSPVKPHRTPKSVGAERTFEKNLSSELFLEDKLQNIAAILEKRLSKNKVAGKTITLKIKYSDFKQLTRSKTGTLYLSSQALIFEQAKELLYQEKLLNSVRLIGISISNLNTLKKKQEVKPLKEASQLCLPF